MKCGTFLSMIAAAVAFTASTVEAATGNPFTGKAFYVQSGFVEELETSIKKETDKTTLANLKKMQSVGSAIWMDTKKNIARGEEALKEANAQSPIPLVTLIVYDLPNRDCHAKASNGEICCVGTSSGESGTCDYSGSSCTSGLADYKKNYIDVVGATLAKYPKVPVVLIIEPDSLPNFATNLDDPRCGSKATQQAYMEGVPYAVTTLAAKCPQCTMYLDAGHGGWLGWADNMAKFKTLLTTTMKLDLKKMRGFATNTANYQPVGKPCAAYDTCLGGKSSDACCKDPCKLLSQYNYAPNEMQYVQMLDHYFKDVMDPHFVIDTGRNAVEDMRADCANWCNANGAGAGQIPTTETALASVDAYHWLKTPGESDGCTETLPDGSKCPRFDSMCGSSDSMKDAPQAGNWFDKQARMLAKNAKLGTSANPPPPAPVNPTKTPAPDSTTKKPTPKKTTKKPKKTTKKKKKTTKKKKKMMDL